jgi:hypothetical protein
MPRRVAVLSTWPGTLSVCAALEVGDYNHDSYTPFFIFSRTNSLIKYVSVLIKHTYVSTKNLLVTESLTSAFTTDDVTSSLTMR